MPLLSKQGMPLRTLIKSKDERREHDENPTEMGEGNEKLNNHYTFSKAGIVSAVCNTITKYTISRPHSPISSRAITPGLASRSQTLDSCENGGEESEATPFEKNRGQVGQRTSPRPRPKSQKEEDRKNISCDHIPFEIPPPPLEFLSQEGLYALFSGAPVFTVLQKDNETPEPRVFFPFNGDDGEELEELSDCPPIAHPAFSVCTSRTHRASNPGSRGCRGKGDYELEEHGGFVEEEPSMLSFMGLEPGSCGWEYFLMYPVGDLENLEVQDDDDRDRDVIDDGRREKGRRGSMVNGKRGIRSVETDYIVERLQELGEIWNDQKSGSGSESSKVVINDLDNTKQPKRVLGQYSSLELYTQLFTRLLYPPTRITTEDFYDPYSLKVQIVALIQALALKKFWLNFKDVQWRIRLGQILWGSKPRGRSDTGDDDEDGVEHNTSGSEAEKVWLLLQILLASELAIRLESFFNDTTIEIATSNGPTGSKEETCKMFKMASTKKVEWDILLARRWLDNVRIIHDEPPTAKTVEHRAPPVPERRNWFSPRSTPPSPPSGKKDDDGGNEMKSYETLIYPRNLKIQFSGLMYFARCLQWPEVDTLSQDLQEKIHSPSTISTPTHSVSGTPLATPLSMMSPGNSYFQSMARPKRIQELSSTALSMTDSGPTRFPALAKTMESGGWMSRTYLSGLILPGEGLPHFLISTLLESDTSAVDGLGYNTNLYNGFRYEGSTWWSSYCIVGKVLAGHSGSQEVCGWVGPCLGSKISTGNGMVFEDAPDGWVDVCTIQLEEEDVRVLNPHRIKEASNPLGMKYGGSKGILSSDLSMPKDDAISDMQVTVEGLILIDTQKDELNLAAEDFKKYEVEVHFQIGNTDMLAVRLKHDIFFITSFPCLEPHSSTEGQDFGSGKQKNGHPLHKEFNYVTASVESIAQKTESKEKDHILVIEAGSKHRGGEVLARAWCAEKGVHAIIGARGRTCLGCCIREAKALAVGVVIRVE